MPKLTPIAWKNLRPVKYHSWLYRTTKRFVTAVAGRGSGKTEIARRHLIRMLPVRKPWANPIYFYALPTERQAKRVAWKELKRLIPKDWIAKINESELWIETVFGSTLYVFGMDKPMRAEGLQYDGGVIDEASDHQPGVFEKTFLPALSDRNGWCWIIGVPKRNGRGAEDFKKMFDDGMKGDDPDHVSFTWSSELVYTEEQLRYARSKLDVKDYNEQYKGIWVRSGGAIFYSFTEQNNVSASAVYNPKLPIHVGSDFNVSPMAWVLAHIIDNKVYVFDEIWLTDTSTPATLTHLHERYGHHRSGWRFYGDATGRSRKTAAATANQSDYIHIKNDKRFHDPELFYLRSNPPLVDRFSSCNAMFENANLEHRVFVNPRCVNLIRDLLTRQYKKGTRDPDDSADDSGHITDAFGYLIHRRFPLSLQTSHVAQIEIVSNTFGFASGSGM